jgi:DNA (cytosine-5)-methyltransferase 1
MRKEVIDHDDVDREAGGMTYMNEIEPFAAEWIHNLYPDATVDTRSITDVQAADVRDFRRAHFFAGVAGWELALQLAGWPGDWPIWSGSCPCQPFSAAGKRQGVEDERHLWPEFFRLINAVRPPCVIGEQVAGRGGLEWWDGVSADLEAAGYTCGAINLGAHSVGAPHIRQRLFWVADAGGERVRVQQPRQDVSAKERVQRENRERQRVRAHSGTDCSHNRLEHAPSDGRQQRRPEPSRGSVAGGCGVGAFGNGPWSDYRLVPCLDGKTRRVGRGVQPLAHGIPRELGPLIARLGKLGVDPKDARRIIRDARRNRVGRLRGYGNAIVPQLAAVFLRAVMEEIGR